MEKNVPISKKIWNIVRFVLYMIRKGISKQKLLADFNATLKRGKNLMFHNRRRVPNAETASQTQKEYEFSCSDTPNYSFLFKKKSHHHKVHNHNHHHQSLFACGHAPPTLDDDTSASRAVLEMLNGVGDGSTTPGLTVEALTALSPYLSSVRSLRVTDSPFPLREDGGDVANGHVDKAADEFIKKFYKNLNQQKKMIEFSPNNY